MYEHTDLKKIYICIKFKIKIVPAAMNVFLVEGSFNATKKCVCDIGKKDF